MHKYKAHIQLKPGNRRAPEQVVAELLLRLFPAPSAPVAIAVGGPGGTGKSTFSTALAECLPDAAVLRLDDYKTPRSVRAAHNIFGPHPKANHLQTLKDHLIELKKGRGFQRPVYDRKAGAATSTMCYTPVRFNILDGEIATYRELRNQIDFSIFVDSDWQTQLAVRIGRDIQERGYDRDKALTTFLHSNLREFSEYGAESKKWADLHLYCDDEYHLFIESVAEELYHREQKLFAPEYTEVGLKGLIVPVLTPFNAAGEIDQYAFIRHLEFLAHHGVHRIMVNGTTAEFYALLPDERKLLLKLARRYFPGLIILHAGGSGLSQNLQEITWANELGADAVAVLPPIYPAALKPDGIIEYLCILQAAADVPFLIYNFPKHSGNPLTPEILKSVPHDGIKDSGQDLSLIKHTPRYFIGSSSNLFSSMQQGAAGFVAATANVRPSLYANLETLMATHRTQEAEQLQEDVRTYTRPFSNGGIPMLKQALSRTLTDYPLQVRPPLRQQFTKSTPTDTHTFS